MLNQSRRTRRIIHRFIEVSLIELTVKVFFAIWLGH